MNQEYLYDAWKENPYCLDCKKPLKDTSHLRCEDCRRDQNSINKQIKMEQERLLDHFQECVDFQDGNDGADEILDNLRRDIRNIRKNLNL